MTARLDVTPKTTEHNRIVCNSKFEAEVTNNEKTCLSTIDATKLTTDRHEASRGLFATAELLVSYLASDSYKTTIEANYWQTRSIARPLCDSRATCSILHLCNVTWPVPACSMVFCFLLKSNNHAAVVLSPNNYFQYGRCQKVSFLVSGHVTVLRILFS